MNPEQRKCSPPCRYSICVFISVLAALLASTAYGLFTATYVRAEVAYGEQPVLVGFSALKKVIATHGVVAYFETLLPFIALTFVCSFLIAGLIASRRRTTLRNITVMTFVIALAGAAFYLSVVQGVIVVDSGAKRSAAFSGIEGVRQAIATFGALSVVMNLLGNWLLLFIAGLFSALSVRKLLGSNNQKGSVTNEN